MKHAKSAHRKHLATAAVFGLGLAAASICLDPGLADADVPSTVAFTGRLSTSEGLVDGNVQVTFRIFDAAEEGKELWSEEHELEAQDGLLFAQLGSSSALGASIFAAPGLYLEVAIDGEALSPRSAIGSVPYAMRSDDTDTLQGFPASSFVRVVTAGNGLLGGGEGGEINLSVDPTTYQRRITGTCADGTAMLSVSATGQVTCGTTGDVTGVTAGTGLIGGGNSGELSMSVDTNVVQARVTGSCDPPNSVRTINADGSLTCNGYGTNPGSGLGISTGPSGATFYIAAGGVTSSMIQDNTIDGADIHANTVNAGLEKDATSDEIRLRVPTLHTRTTAGTTNISSKAFCALADVEGISPSCTTLKTDVTAWALTMGAATTRCAWYCIPY